MRFRPQTTGSFFFSQKRTEPRKHAPMIVSGRYASALPAKLKKLALLKQFLIFNAFSTKSYLKHSKRELKTKQQERRFNSLNHFSLFFYIPSESVGSGLMRE
jgi:hypothetical protein